MEKICSFYNLATIHCELLYWKLYIKYDINNYKLLTVNEYLDVILPSLTHSEFRMKIPFNDPNVNERKNSNSLKSDLCQYYQLKRKSCTVLMKDYRDAMNRRYGDGLYDTNFVMDKIEEIISERGNRISPSTNDDGNDNNIDMVDDDDDDDEVVDVASDAGVHDDIHFIDVDVVEIGTSNFNTIIGFIDIDDPISGDPMIMNNSHYNIVLYLYYGTSIIYLYLCIFMFIIIISFYYAALLLSIGFAIEPINNYLHDLPNRILMHKINAAISNGSYPRFLLNETVPGQLRSDTHKGIDFVSYY